MQGLTRRAGIAWCATTVLAGVAAAFPGGTPSYQTDVAPYCSGCHSSRTVEMLDGSGERAQRELAERKHLAVVLSGQKRYGELTELDRRTLAEQIRAIDAASTVQLAVPERVTAGQLLQVRVDVTGGAGPVVGVGLVDRPHRWYARPAASAGWMVAAPPEITGPDGQLQNEWLARRPVSQGRYVSYVNVLNVASDSANAQWSQSSVVFTLRAPVQPGRYPLTAAYWYGTEKSTVLGYTTTPEGWKEPRGGMGGPSGRILFSTPAAIEVVPPTAPVLPVAEPSTDSPTPPIRVVE